MRDYIKVHLVNEKPIMSLLNMGKMMEYLPAEQFMRVHRSYIVNLDKIHTIERNRIVFDGHVYIPVSNQYKDDFQNFLDTHFLK
jgi:two-component system LytT family response regulator